MALRAGTELKALVALSEQGKFSLPEEIVRKYQTWVEIPKLKWDPPAVVDDEQAGAQLVAAMNRGEDPDLLDFGRAVVAGITKRQESEAAQRVMAAAREQAASLAEMALRDSVESIIEKVLRPRFEEIMAEATELAARLKGASFIQGESVDWTRMMSEDDRTRAARSAWRRMEPLELQRRAILQARYRVDTIGHRTPQKDTEGYFVRLAHPERLQAPGWEPGKPWQSPAPSEKQQANPVLALLWWAVDAAAGEPWLPTCADQDARWEQLFGEWKRQREQQQAAGRWPTIYAN
jgi:hypothetical protein